ncbi:MAG: DUF2971 domain-containing protein [Acinetobacter sp.]|nr:DUF2971 domain-containing protein [Acinetobacter sp.]
MILYKYYGFESGIKALETGKVGFRVPLFFNDPFEVSTILSRDGDTQINTVLANTAVLSLTRTPLNSLMWAHYGHEHKGFVIGYDVDDEFFHCKETNLIPVRKGNMIYTRTKPVLSLTKSVVDDLCLCIDGLDEAKPNVLDLINHLFLNKDTIWSYEEEVRVVKKLSSWAMDHQEFYKNPYNQYTSLSEDIAPGFSRQLMKGLNIYSHQPKISEVYLGVRNKLDETMLNRLNSSKANGAEIYTVSVDKETWNLVSKKYMN